MIRVSCDYCTKDVVTNDFKIVNPGAIGSDDGVPYTSISGNKEVVCNTCYSSMAIWLGEKIADQIADGARHGN